MGAASSTVHAMPLFEPHAYRGDNRWALVLVSHHISRD